MTATTTAASVRRVGTRTTGPSWSQEYDSAGQARASTPRAAARAGTRAGRRCGAGAPGAAWSRNRDTVPPARRKSHDFQKPWPTRCSTAAAGRPRPSCTDMYPIWLVVDAASCPLASARTRLATVPETTEALPRTRSRRSTAGTAATSGHSSVRSIPAPLTTPACSSADTGDGASAVSGSHRCAGTRAERGMHARASSRATAAVAGTGRSADASSARSTVGSATTASTTAAHSAASPSSSTRRT
jgi:hypothetical protein